MWSGFATAERASSVVYCPRHVVRRILRAARVLRLMHDKYAMPQTSLTTSRSAGVGSDRLTYIRQHFSQWYSLISIFIGRRRTNLISLVLSSRVYRVVINFSNYSQTNRPLQPSVTYIHIPLNRYTLFAGLRWATEMYLFLDKRANLSIAVNLSY